MVRVRNETEIDNWFKKNYKKLGFSKIIRKDIGEFPDYIMLENGREVRIELETKTSNFILHNHPIEKVDKIICIEKDIELKIPVIVVKELKLEKFDGETKYSIKNDIYNLFKKEKILVSSDVAKKLNIASGTAERYLLELVIDGKIIRIKKKRLSIWMRK